MERARQFPTPEAGARWLVRQGLLVLEDDPRLPPVAHEVLAAAARRNLAANLLRIHRFQAVADALAPLPLCPLKGVQLLDTVYALDPQHRVMADLDLLLRRSDVAEAVARLADLGYRESAASRRAAPWWHERVLDDGQVPVELHLRLGVKHGPHTTWEEVAPAPGRLHGRDTHRLDDPTTLVHLVVHFVKHGPFVRLAWAEDVMRWVERDAEPESCVGQGETDPGEATARGAAALSVARRLGAARSFVAGVRALARVAGEDFLPTVPRRPPGLAGAAVRLHERLVWPQLAAPSAAPLDAGPASTPWRRNASALLLADRSEDALRFLAAKGRELASRRPAGRR